MFYWITLIPFSLYKRKTHKKKQKQKSWWFNNFRLYDDLDQDKFDFRSNSACGVDALKNV